MTLSLFSFPRLFTTREFIKGLVITIGIICYFPANYFTAVYIVTTGWQTLALSYLSFLAIDTLLFDSYRLLRHKPSNGTEFFRCLISSLTAGYATLYLILYSLPPSTYSFLCKYNSSDGLSAMALICLLMLYSGLYMGFRLITRLTKF